MPSQEEVGDLDERVAVEEALAPGGVDIAEGFCRDGLLDGFSGRFELLDAFLDGDQHVAGLGEVGGELLLRDRDPHPSRRASR